MADFSKSVVIADVEILQDIHGRYSLNALHRASDTGAEKAPNQWTRLKSAKALITELESQTAEMQCETVVGGNAPGIYAHELLAVSYAGWISPAFQLKVNQAFIDSRTPPTLPTILDPDLQAIMRQLEQSKHLLVALDATRQAAREADEKATLALRGQQWLTIRQYVAVHTLARQLPLGQRQKDYGYHLAGYCREHGWPVYKAKSLEGWDENTYPIWAIAETLPGWLTRQNSQGYL